MRPKLYGSMSIIGLSVKVKNLFPDLLGFMNGPCDFIWNVLHDSIISREESNAARFIVLSFDHLLLLLSVFLLNFVKHIHNYNVG